MATSGNLSVSYSTNSYNKYTVTVTFKVTTTSYMRNETGKASYSITCAGQSKSANCTFNISNATATIGTQSFVITMDKSGSSKTISISATLTTGVTPATVTAGQSLTLPARTWQYTVSYNANGGTGAPNSQTKTYGTNLTLSSTIPTYSGYTFRTWNTKADGTGSNYSAGSTYTKNAAVTLYAQWFSSNYSATSSLTTVHPNIITGKGSVWINGAKISSPIPNYRYISVEHPPNYSTNIVVSASTWTAFGSAYNFTIKESGLYHIIFSFTCVGSTRAQILYRLRPSDQTSDNYSSGYEYWASSTKPLITDHYTMSNLQVTTYFEEGTLFNYIPELMSTANNTITIGTMSLHMISLIIKKD